MSRVGKFLELEIDAQSRAEVEPRIREMCDKLLANTVIEDYRFEIRREIEDPWCGIQQSVFSTQD